MILSETTDISTSISTTPETFQTTTDLLDGTIHLTANTGSFSSTGFPFEYNNNERQRWSISLADGYCIQLTVHIIEIETGTDCRYDSLKVNSSFKMMLKLLWLCMNTNFFNIVK